MRELDVLDDVWNNGAFFLTHFFLFDLIFILELSSFFFFFGFNGTTGAGFVHRVGRDPNREGSEGWFKKSSNSKDAKPGDTAHALVKYQVTRMTESAHNYASNMDNMYSIHFPELEKNGEKQKSHLLEIKFDSQCKTESCDYLEFYADQEKNKKLSDQISGSSFRGTTLPITLPKGCSTLWLRFKSDGDTEYWGYKFSTTTTLTRSSRKEGTKLIKIDGDTVDIQIRSTHSTPSYNISVMPVFPTGCLPSTAIPYDVWKVDAHTRWTSSMDYDLIQYVNGVAAENKISATELLSSEFDERFFFHRDILYSDAVAENEQGGGESKEEGEKQESKESKEQEQARLRQARLRQVTAPSSHDVPDLPADWGSLPLSKSRVAVRGCYGNCDGNYAERGQHNGAPWYVKVTDSNGGSNSTKGVLYFDSDCGYWKVCQNDDNPASAGWNHSQQPEGGSTTLPCGAWTQSRAIQGEQRQDYGLVRVLREEVAPSIRGPPASIDVAPLPLLSWLPQSMSVLFGEFGSTAPLRRRFIILKQINKWFQIAVPMINLSLIDTIGEECRHQWSIATCISKCRHLLFETLTMPMFQKGLEKTKQRGNPLGSIKFDSLMAINLKWEHERTEGTVIDHELKRSLFGQFFQRQESFSLASLRANHGGSSSILQVRYNSNELNVSFWLSLYVCVCMCVCVFFFFFFFHVFSHPVFFSFFPIVFFSILKILHFNFKKKFLRRRVLLMDLV